ISIPRPDVVEPARTAAALRPAPARKTKYRFWAGLAAHDLITNSSVDTSHTTSLLIPFLPRVPPYDTRIYTTHRRSSAGQNSFATPSLNTPPSPQSMIVAQNHPRRQASFYQQWSPASTSAVLPSHLAATATPPQTLYDLNSSSASSLFSFDADPTLFDLPAQRVVAGQTQPLMQSDHHNPGWHSSGHLTPTSATRAYHQRESSLSSLGSAGPASPYTATTSNPHVVDYNESKPLTPAHTPSQESFLPPHYSNYYAQPQNLMMMMGTNDGLKGQADAGLMPAPDFGHTGGRPSATSVASSNDIPSTPPSFEEDRRHRIAYRSAVPKLDRTMTDIYQDELYNPSFQITSAPPARQTQSATHSPQLDLFAQRLQAANNQHLSASNAQSSMGLPQRERSPFRQGSPLAPSAHDFASQSPGMRFGTAMHMREQQKAESDARALQMQLERSSPEQAAPKTVSPKDVDLVYHKSDDDMNMPLFPPQTHQAPMYQRPPTHIREPSELEDSMSQQSYGSMATTRRESSSFSASSQQPGHPSTGFNFAPPSIPGSMRQVPQQYPFLSHARRQPTNMSSVGDDFPPTLTSMESSGSDYTNDADIKKPSSTAADGGTYTCTYHNCTLRFDTPAKLQKHKREGHRQSGALAAAGEDGGMTSAAHLRNSQAGPHKCERINPSTGKPCNTIFSRPYDLTRHEDTIHNARKQKVRCHLCTEEKTFSRNDALTRHFRVCHPDVEFPGKRRRGGTTHG
ncbi:hypothetical protein DH86_00002919, partial [Scytalidium sp. 3C]